MGQSTQKLRELCEYVANASNREVPTWKSIVGTAVFTHESGIHADGALKNPRTYEVFDPEDVGLTRKFVVGKHSGTAGVKKKLEEHNISVDEIAARALLENVRKTSIELKRPLNDKELINLYYEYTNKDIKHAI